MDGIYEVNKNSGGTVTQTRTYYPAAGAMRVGSTLYYVLKDQLGSASVVTDATVNALTVGEERYYPFGETRFSTGTMYTDKLFTGQRDTGLGIYYFNARFYSPKLGRFLSADSIVPGAGNPQNLNRYSYTINNPLRYIDPTGHNWEDCGDRSGYRCKIHMNHVAKAKAQWATEAATSRAGTVAHVVGAQQGCTSLACAAGTFSDGFALGGGAGKVFPSLIPQSNPSSNNGGNCPDWSVCVTDGNATTMQSYWDSNNSFLNVAGIAGIVQAIGGVGTAAVGGVTLISPASIALLTGIDLVDPEPISKTLIAAGLVVAVAGVMTYTAAYDIQNVNNAIVESGAYNNGGSITAGPFDVNITANNTTTTVHTHIPFAAAASLSLWAQGNSQLVPGH